MHVCKIALLVHRLAQGLEFPRVTGTNSCFSYMKMNVFTVHKTVFFILVMENFDTAAFKCHLPHHIFLFHLICSQKLKSK